MPNLIGALAIALAYFALAGLSAALAYAPTDAWTVWFSSGLTLGLLLVAQRRRWVTILAGAALGAALFDLAIHGTIADAIGYAVIEVAGGLAGAWLATRVAQGPVTFSSPGELAIFALGGGVQALVTAALAGAWTVAGGGQEALRTFQVWFIADGVGAVLVAPVVIAWSAFRVKRSGGLTTQQFAIGAVACVFFLGLLFVLFSGDTRERFGGSVGTALTYLPVLFMSIMAFSWGARGASLAAFAGAVMALFYTIRNHGPFVAVEDSVGEAQLEVQVFVAAVALTGLLKTALASRERKAYDEARDWRARFENVIGAHRLLAYDWDPVGGKFVVTGDSASLLGFGAARIGSLADWLAHVSPDERDQTATAFGMRAEGTAGPPLTYRMMRGDGTAVTLVDEAEAVRDHEGTMYRITGIVRVASSA